jgi:hypothetical protein
VLTGYIYNAEGERVSKGSITVWSCDPGTNGFKPLSDYIVGRSGEQVTEMGMDPSGSMAWQHTNVYALGKVMATYDNDGGKGGQPESVSERSPDNRSREQERDKYCGAALLPWKRSQGVLLLPW